MVLLPPPKLAKPSGPTGPDQALAIVEQNWKTLFDSISEANKAIQGLDVSDKKHCKQCYDRICQIQQNLGPLTKTMKVLKNEAASKLVQSRQKNPSTPNLTAGSIINIDGVPHKLDPVTMVLQRIVNEPSQPEPEQQTP